MALSRTDCKAGIPGVEVFPSFHSERLCTLSPHERTTADIGKKSCNLCRHCGRFGLGKANDAPDQDFINTQKESLHFVQLVDLAVICLPAGNDRTRTHGWGVGLFVFGCPKKISSCGDASGYVILQQKSFTCDSFCMTWPLSGQSDHILACVRETNDATHPCGCMKRMIRGLGG